VFNVMPRCYDERILLTIGVHRRALLMNLFFWLLLNVIVPVVGPIFTLALVAPTHGWRVARLLIAAAVKNGQLFWCAIGLSAAAIYEAVTALQKGIGAASLLELGIVGWCLLAFACSIFVMSGTIKANHGEAAGFAFAQPCISGGSGGAPWSAAAIRLSIWATAVAAGMFAFLHICLI
jgi:hypothetical protein